VGRRGGLIEIRFVGSKEKKMRLVTFRDGTEERLGFLLDDHVVDPKRMPDHAGEAAYGDAIAFIRAGDAALDAAVQRQQLSRP
jgi:hypothetical protein